MCGILCEVCFNSPSISCDSSIIKRIQRRGPNSMQKTEISIKDGPVIYFYGAVLWMQGSQLTPQPVENDQGILLYNGDVFDETWSNDLSDTYLIMQKIATKNESSHNHQELIIKVLKSLKGPFSIIYYNKNSKDLYFTRDKIGRNSLLLHKTENRIVLSSVLGRTYSCVEVPATHIHILNLETYQMKLYHWTAKGEMPNELCLENWYNERMLLQSMPDEEFMMDFDNNLLLSDHNKIIDFIEATVVSEVSAESIMEKLIIHPTIKEKVLKVLDLLEKSVQIRLKKQPNRCKNCLEDRTDNCDHCTVGILFSGGLDCTILALLADKYLNKEQSIDLFNVAFKKDEKSSFDVPDRVTGRKSLEELKILCSSRRWVFREVNVCKEELEHLQRSEIGDLVFPRQTILDESLGTALWFAARGEDQNSSPCRVLLLGSGADELFGGYTRHRNAYKRHGWAGLSKELLLDWKRISFRNLARDNRVICDHGRQPRMPYLDEDLTDYLIQLEPWFKCFPSEKMGPGVGDKLLLRLVARRLGLSGVATFPKRALQFGSRIANKKEKGSDTSKTFLT